MTVEKLLTPDRAGYLQAAGWCAALACIAGSSGARAATDFNPYASIDYQHTSNVFSLPKNDPLFSRGFSRDDNLAHYVAGAIADFVWGVDSLNLHAEGAEYDYTRNNELNHNEFRFGGTFDWRLSPVISGDLDYTQSRLMNPPANTLAPQLKIQTQRQASGTFRFLLTPRWRLDLNPVWQTYDLPLPAYPQFGYREDSAAVTLNYLGFDKLTAGLRGEYVNGSYDHIIDATKYNQKTAELTAAYALTGFSSLDLQLGYTWRDSSLVNQADASNQGVQQVGLLGTTSAFTGSLGLTRRLSVKTSLNLKLFRSVGSYVASPNPEISTGGEASLTWKPDVRFSFSLLYRNAKESIQGTQVIVEQITDRQDRTSDVEASVSYHAARWFTLRPYAEYHSRSSNLQQANFNTTIFGIAFTARLHPDK